MMHASRASKRVIPAYVTSVLPRPFVNVQSIPCRLHSTTTIKNEAKKQRSLYQNQQQIATYSNIAMPTPSAARVAIIGAGTVGATIAFSLIGTSN